MGKGIEELVRKDVVTGVIWLLIVVTGTAGITGKLVVETTGYIGVIEGTIWTESFLTVVILVRVTFDIFVLFDKIEGDNDTLGCSSEIPIRWSISVSFTQVVWFHAYPGWHRMPKFLWEQFAPLK